VDAARDLQSMAYVLGDGRIRPAEFVDSIEEIAGLLGDPTQIPPLDSGGVRVMSIHAAKGLEFDEVVIPQAVDGVLPQRERGHALLSNASVRALQKKAPTFVATPEEAYQEECSLWYVALTRARRHVLVTAAEADADDIELPLSVFAHAIKDVAAAREPSLAWTTELRSGATIDRVQGRRPLTHVIDHLSPTGVGTFLACPRRFFYKEVLRLAQDSDDEGTVLGRLLHRALAEFHAKERVFRPRPDLEACRSRWSESLSTLAEAAAGAAATEASFAADSSFMRYQLALARQYLVDYAGHLARESIAAPFEVLACEQRLEAQIGGVRFTGQADRIDRLADGTLAIRDYKSGRRYGWLAPAVRKALERIDGGEQLAGDAPEGLNLQLLLYMPGAQALFGAPVSRVEFIYFRGEGEGDGLLADTIQIVEDGSARASDNTLSQAEAQRAQTEIAASVAAACADGSLDAFVTAVDIKTCRFCGFVRACPGPLAVAQ
jgi:ATP-dependent helicase/DNAse subunit B